MTIRLERRRERFSKESESLYGNYRSVCMILSVLLCGLVLLHSNSSLTRTKNMRIATTWTFEARKHESFTKEDKTTVNANANANANNNKQYHVSTTTRNTPLPTLDELVQTITNSTHHHNYSCPNGTVPFPDTPLPPSSIMKKQKKIPQIVHITAKTRCVPPNIFNHLKQWEFSGNALYFYYDEAVHRMIK